MRSIGQDFGQVQQVRPSDNPLNEAALQFIEDGFVYPDDGVKVRYRRLGWSVRKGNKVKQALVLGSWLQEQRIEFGLTRKVLLRLTADGKQRLGFPGAKLERGSLAHEYWKRHYAGALEQQGYQVQVEAPRLGGRADVLASRDSMQIAIEIETGQSRFVENVRNCLRSHIQQVVVVATSRKILGAIQQALAREGLLIPHRVEIILAGEIVPVDYTVSEGNMEDDFLLGDENGEEITATDEGNDAGS